MRKEEKRKIIARKVMTILLLAVSLASVSFACTAYAETMQQETIVYEKVDGVLKQIAIITEDSKEDPQQFREEQRKLAMEEQEDSYDYLEKVRIAIKNTIEKFERKASDCLYSLMS